jgi:hypothetical protein
MPLADQQWAAYHQWAQLDIEAVLMGGDGADAQEKIKANLLGHWYSNITDIQQANSFLFVFLDNPL